MTNKTKALALALISISIICVNFEHLFYRGYVLCIGDSHTSGRLNKDGFYPGGYRKKLKKIIGPHYKLIGPEKDHFSRHAGIGGQKSKQINDRVANLIKKYILPSICRKTIVVWESGYNDLGNNDYESALREIDDGITKFYNACHDIKIIVWNLIPNDDEIGNKRIDQFNAKLAEHVSILKDRIKNIYYLDMNAEFKKPENCNGNVKNCLVAGPTTHPNGLGYDLDGFEIADVINKNKNQ